MKKFIVISSGVDSTGEEWAHQMCPGLFDSPNAALAEFKRDWAKDVQFEIRQLETGTFQILHYEGGNALIEGLIVPIETHKVSGRRA